jgi:hypothetical protein
LWAVAKALQIPLTTSVKDIRDLPYTMTYVIRKRLQLDSLNELPAEKRPPDDILWEGTAEEIDEWLERVFNKKESTGIDVEIADGDIG